MLLIKSYTLSNDHDANMGNFVTTSKASIDHSCRKKREYLVSISIIHGCPGDTHMSSACLAMTSEHVEDVRI